MGTVGVSELVAAALLAPATLGQPSGLVSAGGFLVYRGNAPRGNAPGGSPSFTGWGTPGLVLCVPRIAVGTSAIVPLGMVAGHDDGVTCGSSQVMVTSKLLASCMMPTRSGAI